MLSTNKMISPNFVILLLIVLSFSINFLNNWFLTNLIYFFNLPLLTTCALWNFSGYLFDLRIHQYTNYNCSGASFWVILFSLRFPIFFIKILNEKFKLTGFLSYPLCLNFSFHSYLTLWFWHYSSWNQWKYLFLE